MEMLLDSSLCDSMYDTLNSTNVFSYDEELKAKHSQVCAVLDRLRHATAWINTHQETPKGMDAPTGLMTFMMFASVVKDSIERLREEFGLSATIFDKGHPDSRKFFKNVCMGEPLSIPEEGCPTDDAFFQYFRSLVFAHPGMVTRSQGILLEGEIQYCPFIVEHALKTYAYEPDDYVGVMIYSSVKERDWKTLRVRFSVLKEYLKSRYESLGLVLNKVNKKIKESTKAWKKITVDSQLPPLDQLKFMRDEFDKRCDDWSVYETQQLIDLLECPCTLEVNQSRVKMFRQEIVDFLPALCEAFSRLDYAEYFNIVDHLTEIEVEESRKLNYTLRKIFEYLDTPDKRDWATPDIDMIAQDFVGKWVKIDQRVMSDREIKMLLTLACYYEYGKYQPIKRITNEVL